MFNPTRAVLDNNRVALVFLIGIVWLGYQSFTNMPRDYDPGFVIRTAQVITYFPGASARRVEELVSARLEDVARELPELDYVRSESRTGVSLVNVNIKESYRDMRPIWDSLRRKVDDIAPQLPEGVIGPFVNDEFGDVYGIVMGIRGEGFTDSELSAYATRVQREILNLPDVAKVALYGEQETRIYVDYDNARMAELGLSPLQLTQILQGRNIVMSGGSVKIADQRIELEPSGNYQSIDDIRDTIINIPNSNRLFYLKDIARIYPGYIDPPTSFVHSNGDRALAIAVSMREGGNNIRLGEMLVQTLHDIEASLPHGVEFDVINFLPTEVSQKISDFVSNLVQAILIVTVVMLVSLGMLTGLIVASLIPVTMLLTLIIMSLFNIGLDQISLAALIIALGMLVDNGIVMSENILVKMESGMARTEAAVSAAMELKTPLLIASLTTAAAFLPIFLAESNVGEFTASLFKVVTIALLSSWLLALTLIPLLCVMFIKVKQQQLNLDTRFYNGYRQILSLLLKHKYLTLLCTLLIFIVAMSGFGLVTKMFFPPSDRSYFKLEVELPQGTDISATLRAVDAIEQFIADKLQTGPQREQGVTTWASYIGTGGPRFILSHNPKPSNANYALMILNTSSANIIDKLMQELDRYTFEHLPEASITLRKIDNGPSISYPIEVRIAGKDIDTLSTLAVALKDILYKSEGIGTISDDWGQRIRKLTVDIDQDRALRAGISSQDIAVALQTGLSGLELTEYREGEDIIPVMLRTELPAVHDLGILDSLSIHSQSTGKSVPLKQVADIGIEWEPGNVIRRNGIKTVSVRAQLQPGYTASAVLPVIRQWLESNALEWEPGYFYELGGEAETAGKSNQSIMDKLPLAVMIILLLLVIQFNSIRKTMIVLMTIPLGLIGVVSGLLIADSFFGFMTLLGIISLAGIVINNAIVLLEQIRIETHVNKLTAQEAIIVSAQKRMRPILLTTTTTVLGLLPLYLGGGEMWEPMAIAIMAGLLVSTVLTLGVVPTLYAALFRVRY